MPIPALVLEWLEYKAVDHEETSQDGTNSAETRERHRCYGEICREILEKLEGLGS